MRLSWLREPMTLGDAVPSSQPTAKLQTDPAPHDLPTGTRSCRQARRTIRGGRSRRRTDRSRTSTDTSVDDASCFGGLCFWYRVFVIMSSGEGLPVL